MTTKLPRIQASGSLGDTLELLRVLGRAGWTGMTGESLGYYANWASKHVVDTCYTLLEPRRSMVLSISTIAFNNGVTMHPCAELTGSYNDC